MTGDSSHLRHALHVPRAPLSTFLVFNSSHAHNSPRRWH